MTKFTQFQISQNCIFTFGPIPQMCCRKCLSYLLSPGFDLTQGRKAAGSVRTPHRPAGCTTATTFSNGHAQEGPP